MRREHVKGKMKEAEGRVLREVGKATGDRRLQARGALRQAAGKVESAVGKGQEKVDRMQDRRRVVRGGTVRVTRTKTTIKRRRS